MAVDPLGRLLLPGESYRNGVYRYDYVKPNANRPAHFTSKYLLPEDVPKGARQKSLRAREAELKAVRFDDKGRQLKNNEYQLPDGRYRYRSKDAGDKYSWKLLPDDPVPSGKNQKAKSLREIEEAIAEAVHRGVNLAAGKVTVDQIFTLALTGIGVKKSTLVSYQACYSSQLKKRFGKLPMIDLTEEVLLDYFDTIAENNLSIRSRALARTVLNHIFREAKRQGIVRHNPVRDALEMARRIKPKEDQRRRALTKEEVDALLTFMNSRKIHQKWLPIVTILLGTGLRIGEFTGLTWSDIDFDKGLIHVKRQQKYDKRSGDKPDDLIKSPKTTESASAIPMLADVRDALMVLREKYLSIPPEKRPSIGNCSGFLCINQFGNPMSSHDIGTKLRRLGKDYNTRVMENRDPDEHVLLLPPFSPHWLRHTSGTRVYEATRDPKVTQMFMRHKNILTTLSIYVSPEKDTMIETVKGLDGKLRLK